MGCRYRSGTTLLGVFDSVPESQWIGTAAQESLLDPAVGIGSTTMRCLA